MEVENARVFGERPNRVGLPTDGNHADIAADLSAIILKGLSRRRVRRGPRQETPSRASKILCNRSAEAQAHGLATPLRPSWWLASHNSDFGKTQLGASREPTRWCSSLTVVAIRDPHPRPAGAAIEVQRAGVHDLRAQTPWQCALLEKNRPR